MRGEKNTGVPCAASGTMPGAFLLTFRPRWGRMGERGRCHERAGRGVESHQPRQLLGRTQPGTAGRAAALFRGVLLGRFPLGGAGGVLHRQGAGGGLLPPGRPGGHEALPQAVGVDRGSRGGPVPGLHPGGGRPHRGGEPHVLRVPGRGPREREDVPPAAQLRRGVPALPLWRGRDGPPGGGALRPGPLSGLAHLPLRVSLAPQAAGGFPVPGAERPEEAPARPALFHEGRGAGGAPRPGNGGQGAPHRPGFGAARPGYPRPGGLGAAPLRVAAHLCPGAGTARPHLAGHGPRRPAPAAAPGGK